MVNRMILQGGFALTLNCAAPTAEQQCAASVWRGARRLRTEKRSCFSCVAWQGTAEMICNHFAKGKEIIVEGKPPAGNTRTRLATSALWWS